MCIYGILADVSEGKKPFIMPYFYLFNVQFIFGGAICCLHIECKWRKPFYEIEIAGPSLISNFDYISLTAINV